MSALHELTPKFIEDRLNPPKRKQKAASKTSHKQKIKPKPKPKTSTEAKESVSIEAISKPSKSKKTLKEKK